MFAKENTSHQGSAMQQQVIAEEFCQEHLEGSVASASLTTAKPTLTCFPAAAQNSISPTDQQL